ncbi:hypothetical protein KVR01_001414 [Diaporthe batatas]|uniref:uncharacterized protein n=1 Tax=Diaporthe batatas TaxID=748121 RepID=UPI001D050E8B|nr:uncharacterized protein KVR01_001414 [Diaporthe batatas]KAG8168665.1 hypothetical protein KVR01_001414 [Diaporthe batatas]
MSAVPAWKRLGLKLKGASSDGSPAATTSQPTTTAASAPPPGRFAHHQQRSNFNPDGQYGTPAFNKRKQFQSGSYPASDNKRPRWDDSDFTPSKKSVSFSQDTKKAALKKPKPAKKKKKASKPQPASQTHDLTPSLEYLRTWHKARDAWKFNKNHQTLLLKYMYKAEALPAADIDTFYLYISDIKGGSRTRLIEQAEEIRKKDMEAGPKAFPEGTKGAEEKQGQYEEMLAGLLKENNAAKESGGSNAAPKRSFDEVEFTLRTADKDVQQRLVKRMRAELVIDTLKSSSSEDDTGAPSVSTAKATSSRVKVPVQTGANANSNGTEGTKQKAKRRKKLRTADSSSSESESSSDSDSDSSSDDSTGGADNAGDSSSSSSDSDSDEDSGAANGRANSETSSSSSSSSDSDSEADSSPDAAIAGDEEDTSGSDGDSESSDSDDED